MKKPPKTILTDQDPWLTEAIARELPTTKHSFCIWHITAKFSGWFTAILRNQYYKWCDDFYKLYRLDTVEEFELQWPQLISSYKLQNNKHVNGLYKIKEFWVPSYLRSYFFGGMTTTGRSESINAFVKRFLDSHTCLSQFVRQVDLAIETIEQTQEHDSMLEAYKNASMRTMSPVEEQAQRILTPYAFKKFQEEFVKASQYLILHDFVNEFVVKHHKHRNGPRHTVFWNNETIKCSCKQFEFWGILCRHILSVYSHKDCFEIPSIYLPARWCQKALHDTEGNDALLNDDISLITKVAEEGDDITSEENIVHCPSASKTKGRPKQKRMKGGRELGKQTRSCGFCKRGGHNISTCPEKENVDSSSQPQRKKKKSDDLGLNPIFCLKY